MWVRGLKHGLNISDSLALLVAPHVGAWIETQDHNNKYHHPGVAPHVGAWIETFR